MLLREVLAADAHVAPHGTKQERFKGVADALEANVDFKVKIDAKSARDRYERLQKTFDQDDRRNAMMSGVGGEMTETQEMLSKMKEAREEVVMQRNLAQNEMRKRDERKIAAGKRLVSNSTVPSTDVISNDGSESEAIESEVTPRAKRAKRISHRHQASSSSDMGTDLDRFSQLIRQTDSEQVSVEKERLIFEKEKHTDEMNIRRGEREDRQKALSDAREERKDERESRDRLELEKFKMMMDLLRKEK